MTSLALLQLLIKTFTTHGLGLAISLGYLFRKFFARHEVRIRKFINILYLSGALIFLLLSLSYLIYPNFHDHIEPSVASLAIRYFNSDQIYPGFDDPSFSGLLYGPFTSQFLSVGIGVSGDPILGSKIVSVGSFLVFLLITITTVKNPISKGFVLLLLPFGAHLFWVRPEPIILLLCSVAWLLTIYCRGHTLYLFLGFLSGLCFSVKPHGLVYIGSFLLLSWIGAGKHAVALRLKEVLLFLATSSLTIVIIFFPDTVSLRGYQDYLVLASNHGLLLEHLVRNCGYVIILFIPASLIMILTAQRSIDWVFYGLAVLGALTIAIMGSKAGAGLHHLIPIVFWNVCFIENALQGAPSLVGRLSWLTASMSLVAIYVVMIDLPKFIYKESWLQKWREQTVARTEIINLKETLSSALVAPGDGNTRTYSLNFYRVLFIGREDWQTDPGAFMDLNFSGVSDVPLRQLLDSCRWRFIIAPKGEAAFSIRNFYSGEFLYSKDLRDTFDERYKQIGVFNYYAVFECKVL